MVMEIKEKIENLQLTDSQPLWFHYLPVAETPNSEEEIAVAFPFLEGLPVIVIYRMVQYPDSSE